MIQVEHLYKYFSGREVLSDISTEFEQGKCNLIIGQSGSGKTVLMKCLIGLYGIDKGSIFYDRRNIAQMGKKERNLILREMGVLFQGGALFDSMSVYENVVFPLTMFSDLSLVQKRERVDFCLQRVRLEKAHDLYPSQLSGGMKKRVAIARAIAFNPKYLFCDEPNSGLDPKTSIIIDQLIYEITQEFNTTTIINTHDMNSVMEIGDTVSFIYEGKLWWRGSNAQILQTDNEELRQFIYASRFAQEIYQKRT
ncbi:MAG: ATP-binding cassette domain-containing protein [Bacteroidales bacterium]|jgi:phospholipid/cholesterol/gamma-HCH transport system ATP-binding protein|nr:ATP-binding cassette domain-containing protein [Bacteroidales bacterium]